MSSKLGLFTFWLGWLGIAVCAVSLLLTIGSVTLMAIEKPGQTTQKILPLKTEMTQTLIQTGYRIIENNKKGLAQAKKDAQDRVITVSAPLFLHIAEGFSADKDINKAVAQKGKDKNFFLQPKDVYWFKIVDSGIILYEDNYDNSPPPAMPDFDTIRLKRVTSDSVELEYFAYPYFVFPGFLFYVGGMVGGFLLALAVVMINRNSKKILASR